MPETTSHELTSYDTGARLEPHAWAPSVPDEYGRVDFDNDDSATVVTVWIDRDDAGGYRLHLQADPDLPLQIARQPCP